MLLYEREAWSLGHVRTGGVDEAGRGPWAGPVVAACVVFDAAWAEREAQGCLRDLTDSKKLPRTRREFFFDLLQNTPDVSCASGLSTVEEIDELNILRATHQAMARAVQKLDPLPDFILVDGLPVRGLPCPSRAIVKGDALSLSIAAASVIAKVTRDRLMEELARIHPGYGFEKHKGYGTADHAAALRALGPCAAHRKTFRPVREYLADCVAPARNAPLP